MRATKRFASPPRLAREENTVDRAVQVRIRRPIAQPRLDLLQHRDAEFLGLGELSDLQVHVHQAGNEPCSDRGIVAVDLPGDAHVLAHQRRRLRILSHTIVGIAHDPQRLGRVRMLGPKMLLGRFHTALAIFLRLVETGRTLEAGQLDQFFQDQHLVTEVLLRLGLHDRQDLVVILLRLLVVADPLVTVAEIFEGDRQGWILRKLRGFTLLEPSFQQRDGLRPTVQMDVVHPQVVHRQQRGRVFPSQRGLANLQVLLVELRGILMMARVVKRPRQFVHDERDVEVFRRQVKAENGQRLAESRGRLLVLLRLIVGHPQTPQHHPHVELILSQRLARRPRAFSNIAMASGSWPACWRASAAWQSAMSSCWAAVRPLPPATGGDAGSAARGRAGAGGSGGAGSGSSLAAAGVFAAGGAACLPAAGASAPLARLRPAPSSTAPSRACIISNSRAHRDEMHAMASPPDPKPGFPLGTPPRYARGDNSPHIS